jgi:hypothetical protein
LRNHPRLRANFIAAKAARTTLVASCGRYRVKGKTTIGFGATVVAALT